MKLLIGHSALVAEWTRRQIPHMAGGDFGPCEAIGVIGGKDGADLLGSVVFHNYLPQYGSIEWSAAAKTARWLNPQIISEIVAYPFEQLGCKRITAVIPKKNKRACDFHWRFGFKHEGTIRRLFGSQDAFVFGLLQSDWAKSPFNVNRKIPEKTSSPEAPAVH